MLVADLLRERARIRALYPDTPVYLLGESMGAAVLIAAVAQGAPLDAAGMIMTAPAVWGGDQLNPFYRATLWLAVHLVPALKLTGEGLGVMASDNLEVLRALGADPLFIKATRVDAIAGLVRLMDLALAATPVVPGPLLVLGGARDEVVPPDAHAAMLERLTADPCLEIVYPEGWHLLLRDLQRQVVWDDILAWIDGEPPPSGLGPALRRGGQRGCRSARVIRSAVSSARRPSSPETATFRSPRIAARKASISSFRLSLAAKPRRSSLMSGTPGNISPAPLRAIVAAPAWKSIET